MLEHCFLWKVMDRVNQIEISQVIFLKNYPPSNWVIFSFVSAEEEEAFLEDSKEFLTKKKSVALEAGELLWTQL